MCGKYIAHMHMTAELKAYGLLVLLQIYTQSLPIQLDIIYITENVLLTLLQYSRNTYMCIVELPIC